MRDRQQGCADIEGGIESKEFDSGGAMASNSSKPSPLQSSLLDRLTVSAGSGATDSLMRELSALLGAAALSTTRDLTRWPLVSRSVLNYGVAGFTGRMLTNADIPEVERNIARAIQQFEPRLDPKTLRVEVLTDAPNQTAHVWRVRITADRRDSSVRLPVEFWAVVEAESGHMQMAQ
jgi:type VI secretion system protein ImpF